MDDPIDQHRFDHPYRFAHRRGVFPRVALGVAEARRPRKRRARDLDERRICAVALVLGNSSNRLQSVALSSAGLHAQCNSSWGHLGDVAARIGVFAGFERESQRLERPSVRALWLRNQRWNPWHREYEPLWAGDRRPRIATELRRRPGFVAMVRAPAYV